MDYDFVLKTFNCYVNQFDVNDSIQMKISHSLHVAHLASVLAKKMALTTEEVLFAKILGILHDVGRFLQYQKSQEYNDYKTQIDHASLGCDYLFKEGHIKDFSIPKEFYKKLEVAIRNHNRLEIEPSLTEEELFWAKFIRDVDKIDIYRVKASCFELKFKEMVSQKVKKAFFKHQLIKTEEVENESDEMMQTLAYLYDLNFKESFLLLEESDNLELFLGSIEVDKGFEEEFNSYRKEVREFLKGKIIDE